MVKIVLIGKDGRAPAVEPRHSGGLRRNAVYFL
jgi:hypothetical protein